MRAAPAEPAAPSGLTQQQQRSPDPAASLQAGMRRSLPASASDTAGTSKESKLEDAAMLARFPSLGEFESIFSLGTGELPSQSGLPPLEYQVAVPEGLAGADVDALPPGMAVGVGEEDASSVVGMDDVKDAILSLDASLPSLPPVDDAAGDIDAASAEVTASLRGGAAGGNDDRSSALAERLAARGEKRHKGRPRKRARLPREVPGGASEAGALVRRSAAGVAMAAVKLEASAAAPKLAGPSGLTQALKEARGRGVAACRSSGIASVKVSRSMAAAAGQRTSPLRLRHAAVWEEAAMAKLSTGSLTGQCLALAVSLAQLESEDSEARHSR
eukprot:SM003753S13712  [mRNA]  locus=s3753:217:1350:+ [translate_table: standard]